MSDRGRVDGTVPVAVSRAFDPIVDGGCDGSRECCAEVHIHGCFADRGRCDEPYEHEAPGIGKFLDACERLASVPAPQATPRKEDSHE